MRIKITAMVGLMGLALTTVADAVELKPTPIQTELSKSIMLASADKTDEFSTQDDRKDVTVSGPRRYSLARGIMYSALLPGLGEYYVGHKTKAKMFFATEAFTWVGYFAFRTYGSWRKNDMYDYAAEKANAQLEDKGDEFLDMVGFYIDIDQYNTLGRVWDPERPYLEDTPENHWRWLSAEDQQTYRDLKNSSREAYRRANFMLGLAIASRVISMIDATRDVRRANRKLDDSFSENKGVNYRLVIDPFSSTRQVAITVYTPF